MSTAQRQTHDLQLQQLRDLIRIETAIADHSRLALTEYHERGVWTDFCAEQRRIAAKLRDDANALRTRTSV